MFSGGVDSAATSRKKRLLRRYFPVNFAKFLRTSFFTEHLQTIASEENNFKQKTLIISRMHLSEQSVLNVLS